MNVLVACEESQEVCMAFRAKGHIAFSCDIQECSGGHPEWHIQDDVLPLLSGHRLFWTMDGVEHDDVLNDFWDMIIAFPPCTDLAVSGARHFAKKREDGRQRKAVEFFGKILTAECGRVCVENPVGIISGEYVWNWYPDLCLEYGLPAKPSQIVQPYQFGHPYRKTTCLFERGLKPLVPTNIVKPGDVDEYGFPMNFATRMAIDENGKIISWNDPRTAKMRSKTPRGLAEAMAEQWGGES